MMEFKELSEKINSPTLQRDLQYLNDTGDYPGGYSLEEISLMQEYLAERENSRDRGKKDEA